MYEDNFECPDCDVAMVEVEAGAWRCPECAWEISADYSDEGYDGILGEG